jgi:hypothetical protein
VLLKMFDRKRPFEKFAIFNRALMELRKLPSRLL